MSWEKGLTRLLLSPATVHKIERQLDILGHQMALQHELLGSYHCNQCERMADDNRWLSSMLRDYLDCLEVQYLGTVTWTPQEHGVPSAAQEGVEQA